MFLKFPFDRMTIEPDKMGGNPCIRGMRITVRRVLEILATYTERKELFAEYPYLEKEDLQQALSFAAAALEGTLDMHLDAACLGSGVAAIHGRCSSRESLGCTACPGSRNVSRLGFEHH